MYAMTTEEKWRIVRDYYGEKAFRRPGNWKPFRPTDAQIDLLYENMHRLKETFHEYFEKTRGAIQKFAEWRPDLGE